jgi:hypothetical protein
MSEVNERPILVPIGPPGASQTSRFALLVAFAIAVAIIKPWNLVAGPPAASPPTSGTARPTLQVQTPRSPGAMTEPGLDLETEQCYVGAAWRLFTVEQNFGRRMRSWIGIEPLVAARRPALEDIPVVRLLTERLDAVGVCTAFRVESPMVGVEGWRVANEGKWTEVDLVPAASLTQPDTAIGAVFAPPTGAGDAAHGWNVGRYVFRVTEASGDPHWFAVQVNLVPPHASPPDKATPTPAPAGSPSG